MGAGCEQRMAGGGRTGTQGAATRRRRRQCRTGSAPGRAAPAAARRDADRQRRPARARRQGTEPGRRGGAMRGFGALLRAPRQRQCRGGRSRDGIWRAKALPSSSCRACRTPRTFPCSWCCPTARTASSAPAPARWRSHAAQAEPALQDLGEGDVVLLQGNLSLDTTAFILDTAQRQGATTLFNPAPFWPGAETLVGRCSLVIANTVEAQSLGESIHDAKAALVTLGADGCLLIERAERRAFPAEIVERDRYDRLRRHLLRRAGRSARPRFHHRGRHWRGPEGRRPDGDAARRLSGPAVARGARRDSATMLIPEQYARSTLLHAALEGPSLAVGTTRYNHTSTSARSWNQLWAWTYFLILADSARGVVS